MKEKLFGCIFAVIVGAVVVHGDVVQNPLVPHSVLSRKPDLSPEEKAARKEAAWRRFYARTGGYLQVTNKNERTVALVNYESATSESNLIEVASSIRSGMQFNVRVSTAKPDDAGVVVEVRDSDYPAAILVAPESGYAMVNASYLKKDNPSSGVLSARIKKEVWRAFVYMLGGGNDVQPQCLMKTIASLEELDKIESVCPCPLSFPIVVEGAKRFGVEPVRRTTYRKAVTEGWAPAPTNEVQKIIWEEVHAKPTNPMKIIFDPTKGE